MKNRIDNKKDKKTLIRNMNVNTKKHKNEIIDDNAIEDEIIALVDKYSIPLLIDKYLMDSLSSSEANLLMIFIGRGKSI